MLMAALFGMVSGFIFAIPAGPVTVLILRNTGKGQIYNGLAALLGLVLAEILYIIVVLSGVYPMLVANQLLFGLFRLIGAALVLGIAVRLFMAQKNAARWHLPLTHEPAKAVVRNILSGFSIAIANPAILFFLLSIMSSFAIFAGSQVNHHEAVILMVCTEIGSIMWFACIILGMHCFRRRFITLLERYLEQTSALLLFGLGLLLLLKGLKGVVAL